MEGDFYLADIKFFHSLPVSFYKFLYFLVLKKNSMKMFTFTHNMFMDKRNFYSPLFSLSFSTTLIIKYFEKNWVTMFCFSLLITIYFKKKNQSTIREPAERIFETFYSLGQWDPLHFHSETHGQLVNMALHVIFQEWKLTGRNIVNKKITHSWLHMKLTLKEN